jgi:hypothetical protein
VVRHLNEADIRAALHWDDMFVQAKAHLAALRQARL